MIVVDCLMGWIQGIRFDRLRYTLDDSMTAVRAHIRNGRALAVDIPCAFTLVRGGGAAPEKIVP